MDTDGEWCVKARNAGLKNKSNQSADSSQSYTLQRTPKK